MAEDDERLHEDNRGGQATGFGVGIGGFDEVC